MPTPNENLALSLTLLRDLQKTGRRVFRADELSRIHRDRLLRNGFLQEVVKGWLVSSGPDARDGDSTPWYASFHEFCALYCEDRFGTEWHLSPEHSLLLHAENTVIPAQVVIRSPRGGNNKMPLPFGTSLYDLRETQMAPASDLITKNGLRMYSAAAALVGVTETFFRHNPVEARIVLAGIRDLSDLLRHLLDGGRSVVAGRLAGALRRVRRPELADEILTTMKSAGYDVRETDPFAPNHAVTELPASEPPLVVRMRAMWTALRGPVLKAFPKPPGRPRSRDKYLRLVDARYRSDAYHSLSIEGYQVSDELIGRVRAGQWNPERRPEDRRNRDALAARGYWQAFQRVKEAVAEIVGGADPGEVARTKHRDWYRELFQPCVAAGLIPASALAGYRNDAVYLRTSRYVPPRHEAVRDAMPALFALLRAEPEPAVRAVLGHWMFGYIHPYPDGNGRMARFLMNAMLASGGYPWTIVRVDDRAEYLAALDSASVGTDIVPFARFLAKRVRLAMKETGMVPGMVSRHVPKKAAARA